MSHFGKYNGYIPYLPLTYYVLECLMLIVYMCEALLCNKFRLTDKGSEDKGIL